MEGKANKANKIMDQMDKKNLQKVELKKAPAPQRSLARIKIIPVPENEQEDARLMILDALLSQTGKLVQSFAKSEDAILKRFGKERTNALHLLTKSVSTLNLSDDKKTTTYR